MPGPNRSCFFCHRHTLSQLNKITLYTIENEDTNTIMFCHFFTDREHPAHGEYLTYLEESCALLDAIYPKITVKLLLVQGDFTPLNVAELSDAINVPRYFMLMSCPTDKFPHQLSQFGGVRVVTHS